MTFNYEPVLFGQVRSKQGGAKVQGTTLNELISLFKYGDHDMGDACMRTRGKDSFFNNKYIYDDKVCPTMTAKNVNVRVCDKMYQSCEDLIHCSTFPKDYDFINFSQTNVHYICGMSVPPIMIKRIVTRLIESGVFSNENDKGN